jgi:hypothetical protein
MYLGLVFTLGSAYSPSVFGIHTVAMTSGEPHSQGVFSSRGRIQLMYSPWVEHIQPGLHSQADNTAKIDKARASVKCRLLTWTPTHIPNAMSLKVTQAQEQHSIILLYQWARERFREDFGKHVVSGVLHPSMVFRVLQNT